MTTTDRTVTRHATSADGTRIAYDATGAGPALVIVEGALCQRSMGVAKMLAPELAGTFTVLGYDRRGRGESGAGNTPWALEREVEDLAAVIDAAGGSAHVLGASSGAALALEGARRGLPIQRLVGYEAPFILDDTHAPNPLDLPAQLQRLVDQDRRGAAVALFLRTVGAPAPVRLMMRVMPVWKKLAAVAHTLPHDLSIVVGFEQGEPLPAGYYDQVTSDTLMLAGGRSPAYLQNAQAAIADALPSGRVETLAGQTHMVKPKVVAPVATRHLLGA